MADATKNLDIVISVKEDVGQRLKAMKNQFTDMAQQAQAGAALITGGLGFIATKAIEGAGAYEQQKIALTTLLKDQGKALQTIQDIQKDAIQTPFGFSELVRSNQLLISAGVSAKDARKDIMGLANAVAATGGGSDELNRLAINLQQIKNIGEASALDIKQFGFAGINIYGLLSKATGKNIAELKESKITYEDITKALGMAAEKGGDYENALANQSKSLDGLKSSIMDVLSIGLTSILIDTGLFDALTTGLQQFLGFLQTAIPQVTQFIKAFLDNEPALLGFLGAFAALLVPLAVGLWGLLAPVLPFIAAGAALGAVVGLIVQHMGGWDAVTKQLGQTWTWIVGIYDQYLKPAFETIARELTDFAVTILPMVVQVWNNFGTIITQGLATLSAAWNGNWLGIRTILTTTWQLMTAQLKFWWGVIQVFITTALALLSGDFKTAFTAWQKGWTDMMKGLEGITRIVLDIILNLFKDKINGVIGIMNGLIDGINKVSGGKTNMSKIPTFRHGGIVPGGINDAIPAILHGGERVVPRSGVDANGGGSAININVNGNFMLDSEERVNDLAQRIIDILNRQNEIAAKGLSV